MKLKQAALQALEALVVAEEFVDRHSEDWYISGQQDLKQIRESITALREALDHSGEANEMVDEQAEQEQPELEPDGICQEPDGCPTELAVLQRFYREKQSEQRSDSERMEPVAWGRVFDGDIIDCICPEEHALNEGAYTIPLYAAPVRTKDLTESDVTKAIEPFRNEFVASGRTTMNIARAVITADREKNRGTA